MRGDINFGLGVLHSAVLYARLRRRRKLVRAVLALLVATAALIASRPLLLGHGVLVLTNLPPDATAALDGRPTNPIAQPLSGDHTLDIARPAAYPLTLGLTITRNQTTTLSVPPLRPRPSVQPIPLPAPGARWRFAAPDPAGGWRLTATTADVAPTPQASNYGLPDTPVQQQLRLDKLGLTRLSVLEAYPAADELITSAGHFWAAWEPLSTDFRAESGRLTINTPTAATIITTTAPVSGVWWAPDGQRLLIATRHGLGNDLLLWTATRSMSITDPPLGIVPGEVVAVHWSPSGDAAVVLSMPRSSSSLGRGAPTPAQPTNWDATLIIPGSRPEDARAARLAPPPPAPLGMIPMAWSADALYWTAQDGQELALQRIPFATALPTRLGALPSGTVAVCVVAEEQVRVLVYATEPTSTTAGGDTLTMRTWPSNVSLFTLDDISAEPQIGGLWNGDVLLLTSGNGDLWQLTFAPEALR